MEASLKAGYTGGILSLKAISGASGILLFFLSIYSYLKCTCIEEQTSVLRKLCKDAGEQTVLLKDLSAHLDKSPDEAEKPDT